MADRPTINEFNPTGARFVAAPKHDEYGYWSVYRWDPPAGYSPVATCIGMQSASAAQQARELAAWYNERYPLA